MLNGRTYFLVNGEGSKAFLVYAGSSEEADKVDILTAARAGLSVAKSQPGVRVHLQVYLPGKGEGGGQEGGVLMGEVSASLGGDLPANLVVEWNEATEDALQSGVQRLVAHGVKALFAQASDHSESGGVGRGEANVGFEFLVDLVNEAEIPAKFVAISCCHSGGAKLVFQRRVEVGRGYGWTEFITSTEALGVSRRSALGSCMFQRMWKVVPRCGFVWQIWVKLGKRRGKREGGREVELFNPQHASSCRGGGGLLSLSNFGLNLLPAVEKQARREKSLEDGASLAGEGVGAGAEEGGSAASGEAMLPAGQWTVEDEVGLLEDEPRGRMQAALSHLSQAGLGWVRQRAVMGVRVSDSNEGVRRQLFTLVAQRRLPPDVAVICELIAAHLLNGGVSSVSERVSAMLSAAQGELVQPVSGGSRLPEGGVGGMDAAPAVVDGSSSGRGGRAEGSGGGLISGSGRCLREGVEELRAPFSGRITRIEVIGEGGAMICCPATGVNVLPRSAEPLRSLLRFVVFGGGSGSHSGRIELTGRGGPCVVRIEGGHITLGGSAVDLDAARSLLGWRSSTTASEVGSSATGGGVPMTPDRVDGDVGLITGRVAPTEPGSAWALALARSMAERDPIIFVEPSPDSAGATIGALADYDGQSFVVADREVAGCTVNVAFLVASESG
jgi:hypothetical protein